MYPSRYTSYPHNACCLSRYPKIHAAPFCSPTIHAVHLITPRYNVTNGKISIPQDVWCQILFPCNTFCLILLPHLIAQLTSTMHASHLVIPMIHAAQLFTQGYIHAAQLVTPLYMRPHFFTHDTCYPISLPPQYMLTHPVT